MKLHGFYGIYQFLKTTTYTQLIHSLPTILKYMYQLVKTNDKLLNQNKSIIIQIFKLFKYSFNQLENFKVLSNVDFLSKLFNQKLKTNYDNNDSSQDQLQPIFCIVDRVNLSQTKQFIDYCNIKTRQYSFTSRDSNNINNFLQIQNDNHLNSIKNHFSYYVRRQCYACIQDIADGKLLPTSKQPYFIRQFNINNYEQIMKECICALLNCGGGFLFFNKTQKHNLEGVPLQKIGASENQIEQKLKSIIMKFFLHNFIDQKQLIDNYVRIQFPVLDSPGQSKLLKIMVRPFKQNHIHSVKHEKFPYQPQYYYFFKNKNEVVVIDKAIYGFAYLIGKIYDNYEVKICLKTPKCLKFGSIRPLQKQIVSHLIQNYIGDNKLNFSLSKKDHCINFPYKNCLFLIIIHTQKQFSIISLIEKILKQKGYKYYLCQPFAQYNKIQKVRYYVLNYNQDFDLIQQLLNKQENDKSFNLVKIQNFLKFQNNNRNKNICDNMESQIKNIFDVIYQRKSTNTHIYYGFTTFSHLIFSFIYLGSREIRASIISKTKYQNQII